MPSLLRGRAGHDCEERAMTNKGIDYAAVVIGFVLAVICAGMWL